MSWTRGGELREASGGVAELDVGRDDALEARARGLGLAEAGMRLAQKINDTQQRRLLHRPGA